jgi:hypothetical protein
MMTKHRLIILLIWCAAGIRAEAQVNCATATKLVCLIPFITNTFLPGSSAQATANAVGFNGPIGAQLSQLPLAASAPGAVVLFVNGNPESFDNLGPILLDRPDSVGRGRLVFGFSFQQFNFNHLDGIGLGSVPFTYSATSSGEYPVQYIAQTEHVSLKYNQYVALATYGLPKKIDISIVVPFARVSVGAGTTSSTAYFLTADNTLGPNIPVATTYVPGFASGFGDLSINVKHVLWSGGESGRGSFAVGGVLRIPTGDALNYLGSGAYGFNIYALASYKARISPHVKIANQWNSNSVLLDPSGATHQRLPGGIEYGGGVDARIVRPLTASADVLGNQFVNTPSFTVGSTTIPYSSTPLPSGASTISLPTVSVVPHTYTTANLSAGLKWKPFRKESIILYGNVLLQLNDVGLRSGPAPSGGISYSFKPGK